MPFGCLFKLPTTVANVWLSSYDNVCGSSLACGPRLLLALTLYLPLCATLSEQMELNKWVLCLHERRVQRWWGRQWGLTHTRISASTSSAHVPLKWTKKKVSYNSQNKRRLFPWTALGVFFFYNENAAFTEKQEIIVTHCVAVSQAKETLAMAQAVNRGAPIAATGGSCAFNPCGV